MQTDVNVMINNDMKKRNISWKKEEIEKLKNDFQSGKRIKLIAHELGRSTSAVLKFLSRSGLTKRNINKTFNNDQKRTIREKVPLQSKTLLFNKKVNKSNFSDVLRYLKSKGYNICKMPEIIPNLIMDDEIFQMNSKIITKTRLVLLANRLRVEEKEKIFEIEEILNS
jgi:hypothetical protein